MDKNKLYIVMVGLPARGKSTIAAKLQENLSRDRIKTKIFNNGDLRRRLLPGDTSYPEFYDPNNRRGAEFREKIALMNLERAKRFLARGGQVAILDATNVSRKRRAKVQEFLKDHPLLFLECVNNDRDILEASILRKITLPEFNHLETSVAIDGFKRRIHYYDTIYSPLTDETNFVKLDSLNNKILHEEVSGGIPYYDRIRDSIVTDTVKNLYLIRHGETTFNLENRIGGDSSLTEKGRQQAEALARYFATKKIPVIFTSSKKSTMETAEPIRAKQHNCTIIPLAEFDEIDGGICEGMSYDEIRQRMPDIYQQRKEDKYNYIYPNGEGYASMKERIDRGIKKALYLSSNSNNIMIIGHRAVNRMILSHFLYRRTEDVPFVYIPQDKFYHIVATQDRKVFKLKRFDAAVKE